MKSQLRILLLSFFVALASCSDDDTTPNNQLAGDNGFQYNSVAYITENVYVTQDNEIILSSRQVSENEILTEIDFASFTTNDEILQARSYYVGMDLTSCRAITNADWNLGAIENGEVILGENNASSGFLRILHIDRIQQEIDIIFEFKRTDGKLVAGTYQGTFQLAIF